MTRGKRRLVGDVSALDGTPRSLVRIRPEIAKAARVGVVVC